MNFKQWLENFELEQKKADFYFSIGHGDDDEPYVVWAYLNGKIKTAEEGTHGSNWSHDVTDYTYKDRYEPDSGRLSIVKPSKWMQKPIPEALMAQLRITFKNISDVHVF